MWCIRCVTTKCYHFQFWHNAFCAGGLTECCRHDAGSEEVPWGKDERTLYRQPYKPRKDENNAWLLTDCREGSLACSDHNLEVYICKVGVGAFLGTKNRSHAARGRVAAYQFEVSSRVLRTWNGEVSYWVTVGLAVSHHYCISKSWVMHSGAKTIAIEFTLEILDLMVACFWLEFCKCHFVHNRLGRRCGCARCLFRMWFCVVVVVCHSWLCSCSNGIPKELEVIESWPQYRVAQVWSMTSFEFRWLYGYSHCCYISHMSTFASEHVKTLTVSDHFLKFRCGKIAEKWHTAVAPSAFSSQNVKNNCVLHHFSKFHWAS